MLKGAGNVCVRQVSGVILLLTLPLPPSPQLPPRSNRFIHRPLTYPDDCSESTPCLGPSLRNRVCLCRRQTSCACRPAVIKRSHLAPADGGVKAPCGCLTRHLSPRWRRHMLPVKSRQRLHHQRGPSCSLPASCIWPEWSSSVLIPCYCSRPDSHYNVIAQYIEPY